MLSFLSPALQSLLQSSKISEPAIFRPYPKATSSCEIGNGINEIIDKYSRDNFSHKEPTVFEGWPEILKIIKNDLLRLIKAAYPELQDISIKIKTPVKGCGWSDVRVTAKQE